MYDIQHTDVSRRCWICSIAIATRGPLYWLVRWHLHRISLAAIEELADAAAVRDARASIEAGEALIPWEDASDAELAALRHRNHLMMGDRGKCDDSCTHEPYPPCPVCGEAP